MSIFRVERMQSEEGGGRRGRGKGEVEEEGEEEGGEEEEEDEEERGGGEGKRKKESIENRMLEQFRTTCINNDCPRQSETEVWTR